MNTQDLTLTPSPNEIHQSFVQLVWKQRDSEYLMPEFTNETLAEFIEGARSLRDIIQRRDHSHFLFRCHELLTRCVTTVCPNITLLECGIFYPTSQEIRSASESMNSDNPSEETRMWWHCFSVLSDTLTLITPLSRWEIVDGDDDGQPVDAGIMDAPLQTLYRFWQACKMANPALIFPLMPIYVSFVDKYLAIHNAQRIDGAHERNKPAGLLPRRSAAHLRANFYSDATESATVQQDAPLVGQLLLPDPVFDSPLPNILPLQMVEGVRLTTRPGHVSMAVRLVFEGAMILEGKERKKDFSKTLGELTTDLSHHVKRVQRRDVDSVITAIRELDQIRIPYMTDAGPGAFRPVTAWNEPRDGADYNFLVHFRSQWPEDDDGGALVIKAIVRSLYASAAQLNQYLTACSIFNQHGRNPQGGLINPSMPDPDSPRCPKTNALINPQTNQPILDDKGHLVRDIYHPTAVKVLPRIYRSEADAYPVVTDMLDLIRMAYPHLNVSKLSKSMIRRYKQLSLEALNRLITIGHIDGRQIQGGWQFLPSQDHVTLHNAIRKSKG